MQMKAGVDAPAFLVKKRKLDSCAELKEIENLL